MAGVVCGYEEDAIVPIAARDQAMKKSKKRQIVWSDLEGDATLQAELCKEGQKSLAVNFFSIFPLLFTLSITLRKMLAPL